MTQKPMVVTTLFAAVLLLAGCTSGATEPSPTASPSATANEEAGGGQPIATETIVPDPAAPDDTTEVEIQSLIVDGDVMILRYSAIPDFASRAESETISLADAMGAGATFTSSQISLIDRANLKAYAVLNASPGWWAADDVDTVNGTPARSYAVFAAPEDEIDTIDVSFNAQFPQLSDVPITTDAQ